MKYIDICDSNGNVLDLLPTLSIRSGGYTEQNLYATQLRNANGKMKSIFLRTIFSINCNWSVLTYNVWNKVCSYLNKNDYIYIKVFDPATGDLSIKQMMVGERTATPYFVNEETGIPEYYIDCAFTLEEV